MEYIDYYLTVNEDLKIIANCNGNYINGVLNLSEEDDSLIKSAMENLEDESEITEKNQRKDLIEMVGSKLADALFPSEIKKYFYEKKNEAEGQKKGIRIRLNVKAFALINYPWESLFLDEKYLAISVSTPFTRFIDNANTSIKSFNKPLKILIICSSPTSSGLSAVDIENEITSIQTSLEKEIKDELVFLTIERQATYKNIINHLNDEDFNIVHYIGHGVFKKDEGVGYLALVKENSNDPDYADHKRIGIIFQNGNSLEKSLALIVLNACQGAQLGSSKAFTGLASELIKMGFPTIIAMRHSITNQSAHFFSREFYHNLLKMPIDEKLQIVRQKILVDPEADPFDFTAPVLFMVSENGIILKSKDITDGGNINGEEQLYKNILKD